MHIFFRLGSTSCSYNGTGLKADTCILTVYTHSKSSDTILTSCSCSFREAASEILSRHGWTFREDAVYSVWYAQNWELQSLFLTFLICIHYSPFRKCICNMVIQSRRGHTLSAAVIKAQQHKIFLTEQNVWMCFVLKWIAMWIWDNPNQSLLCDFKKLSI